jgi:antirestriction protein
MAKSSKKRLSNALEQFNAKNRKKTGAKTLKGILASTGQNKPQSSKYSAGRDASRKGKPGGWRFTNAGAKALGVSPAATPTKAQIEQYRDKKIKGHRYLYEEMRVDKSDVSPKAKFAKGGSLFDLHHEDGTVVNNMTSQDVIAHANTVSHYDRQDNGDAEMTEFDEAKKYLHSTGHKVVAAGGGINMEAMRIKVDAILRPHGVTAKVDDLGSEINITPRVTEKSKVKAGSLDGMQIIFDKQTGTYEVSEYQAGPKQDELHIYLETKSLTAALKNLLKGNGRKPIKIWDNDQSVKGPKIKGQHFAKGGQAKAGIGVTRSGKTIYADYSHPDHKDFSMKDHMDAYSMKSKIGHNGRVHGLTTDERDKFIKDSWKHEEHFFDEYQKVKHTDSGSENAKASIAHGDKEAEKYYRTLHGDFTNAYNDAAKANSKKGLYAKGGSLDRKNAIKEAEAMGVDFDKDFHAQSKGNEMAELAKKYGYKKPASASGSTGRYFFDHLSKLKAKKYAKGGSTDDESPKIYVADLAAYNEGKLIGEWLTLTDYSSGEEVMEAIHDLLKTWSEEQGEEREEYAIHDTENIPRSLYSEGMAEDEFQKVIDACAKADEMGIPLEVLLQWAGDVGADIDSASDAYQGEYDDEEDFAYQTVEDVGISNPEYYMMISETDQRIIAGEEADNRIENMSDDDLISEANLDDELSELDEDDEDYDEKKDALVERAKSEVYDEIYNEVHRKLDDPVDYFVEEQGIYTIEDLQKQSFIQIDYEKLARDLGHDYNFYNHDGKVYVFSANYKKGGILFAKGGQAGGPIQADLFAEGGQASENFKREISLGKIDYDGRGRKINKVTIDVEIRNKENAKDWETLKELHNVPEVAMSGNVWNGRGTDISAGGQMLDELARFYRGNEKVQRLIAIWKKYHLNDMKAGTKKQSAAIEAWEVSGNKYSYDGVVEHLKSIGLYEDNGYKYGHGWLYQPVPESVISEIKQLCDDLAGEKFAEGGSVFGDSEAASFVPEPEFARGGTAMMDAPARITNSEANTYSEHRLAFRGANLEGKTLDNGDYVVLSYGHYPIWYYNSKEGKWYGNSDKYSVTTSRQLSQSRPDWNATMLSHAELVEKMKSEDARFDLGGIMVQQMTSMPLDNTTTAHQ